MKFITIGDKVFVIDFEHDGDYYLCQVIDGEAASLPGIRISAEILDAKGIDIVDAADYNEFVAWCAKNRGEKL